MPSQDSALVITNMKADVKEICRWSVSHQEKMKSHYTPVFEKRDELLKQFGKHKTSKTSIYFKKQEDEKTDVLKRMITNSVNIPGIANNNKNTLKA